MNIPHDVGELFSYAGVHTAAILLRYFTFVNMFWKLEDEDFSLLLGQARARFELACVREIRHAK